MRSKRVWLNEGNTFNDERIKWKQCKMTGL